MQAREPRAPELEAAGLTMYGHGQTQIEVEQMGAEEAEIAQPFQKPVADLTAAELLEGVLAANR